MTSHGHGRGIRRHNVDLALDVRAELGEGPVWDHRAGVLWWVDILRGEVHRYDPGLDRDQSVTIGMMVGVAVPRAGGGLVLAMEDGFAELTDECSSPVVRSPVEAGRSAVRMNDGKCDPAGRLWAGSMAIDAAGSLGRLYRLDPSWLATEVMSGIGISNGIAWSSDARTMYFIDSSTGGIDAFDFDLQHGSIARRRRAMDVPGPGIPDGLTIDDEGCLWVALYGGGQVRRYAPNGRLVGRVDLPTPNVTSCTFGGPDGTTLWITTAANGIDRANAEAGKAGSVFVSDPGVSGPPAVPFSG